MSRLLIILLRILFPLDHVARSRELMRAWLQMMMTWIADPLDVEVFEDDPQDRAKLEGHIAACEYAMQVLVHERARELMDLPFLYIPRQLNPEYRRAKTMAQLFRRLTQLARNFHNLDKLAARHAERMKRELEQNPLRLDATHQSTSPSLRLVEAIWTSNMHRRLASTSAPHWARWIARSCAQDGGGRAFPRGPPHITLLPIADCPLPQKRSF